MNPIVGWVLAALAVGLAWQKYGWQGAAFAGTLVVFWLLLQFNRAVRVMKNASSAPVAHVPNAVMLNSKLKRGMTMIQVVTLTQSLGRRMAENPETWSWADEGRSSVTLVFDNGRLARWTLDRPVEP
jgi:glucose-6-phosphate-specific signal transduction histidine kinase